MNGFYVLHIYYYLFLLFVTTKVSGSAVKINNLNDAGNPVTSGSFGIIENSIGELYFVLEQQSSRRKEQDHIGIVGGRAEEIDRMPGILETPLVTMIRETSQEVKLVELTSSLEKSLHQTGVVTLHDIRNEFPPAVATLFSLRAEFELVIDEEVLGVIYNKQKVIDILQEETGYLKFRPIVLEALALHFGIDLSEEQKVIGIKDHNYAQKPTAVIEALISILSTGK